MKLFLLTRKDSITWEEYEGAVVCAKNEKDARSIHPDGSVYDEAAISSVWNTWATQKNIICQEIGTANKDQKRGVILASNTGS